MDKEYDVAIVGTGVAGLYAALQFANKDVSVLLLSKKEAELSNSSLAQGGVACVLDLENDSYDLHINDTMIAGKQENNKKAVEVLVKEGPLDVLKIKDYGVDFDLDNDGKLCKTLEAGHSRHRIVHHKDSTGKAMVDALLARVKMQKNITLCENTMVYALEKTENGFWLGIMDDDGKKAIFVHYCMLCTGGIGRVYKYTTNSAIATGDGIALAYRAGARIKNLSYIQFHPTAFAAQKNRERFLISEAVRGEGAYLLNCKGERFASDYDQRGELAPRDVVSNAIIRESIKQNDEHFYLDITHKDADFVKNRFPMIYQRALDEGIDITKERIPIFPCQHYLMGGIDIDLYGRTCVDRLYAAGECSHSGVHGKNRLASNSLLEALVFSRRGACDILSRLEKTKGEKAGTLIKEFDKGGDLPLPKGLRTEIREILQTTAFVLPKDELLEESIKHIEKVLDTVFSGRYEITRDLIEAQSLAIVAHTILKERLDNKKC